MTIKELEKKIEKHQADIKEIKDKISKEEAGAEKFKEAAMDAAAAGDVVSYRKNKDSEQAARDNAFVLNAQLARMDNFADKTEVLDAWENYRSEYSEKFDSLYKKLVSARKEYEDLFMEIIDEQNNALKTRENLGHLMGIARAALYVTGEEAYPGIPMPALFPIEFNIGVNVRGCNFSIDGAHYIMTHDTFPTPNPLLEKFTSVIKLHRAYK